MSPPERDTDPLAPWLTPAVLDRRLRRAVRPVPSDREMIEILPDQMPPAWQHMIRFDLLPFPREVAPGRLVLPRAVWTAHADVLRANCRLVLLARNAVLRAGQGPTEEALAQAPYLRHWLMCRIDAFVPYLLGWQGGSPSQLGRQYGASLVFGLGPRRRWACLLYGWVRLSRAGALDWRPEPTGDKGEPAFRLLDRKEAAAMLAGQRAAIVRKMQAPIAPDEKERAP